MKNIVIINAYGNKNIGDGAILAVALKLIDEVLEEGSNIYIFLEDQKEINTNSKLRSKIISVQSPYGQAIHGKSRKLAYHEKLVNFILIWVKTWYYLFFSLINPAILPSSGFYSYIKTTSNADCVISMGGGYFAPKNKYKDYFGLLLTLLPIYVSKFYKKRVLFLPITFGSFTTKLQEKITYQALSQTTVMCRESISFNRLKRLDPKNDQIKKFLFPDLALFSDTPVDSPKSAKKYIVLTARDWLETDKQSKYEKVLAKFIDYISDNHNLSTVIISMVNNPLDDNDNEVALRIKSLAKNGNNISIVIPNNPLEVQQILKNAQLAICTRLHSAILATTVLTPFITIAYGIKTHGYLEMFGLKEWNIDIETITYKKLVGKFGKLYQPNNLTSFRMKLTNSLQDIKKYRSVIKLDISKFIYHQHIKSEFV